jgi:hypothetical protein
MERIRIFISKDMKVMMNNGGILFRWLIWVSILFLGIAGKPLDGLAQPITAGTVISSSGAATPAANAFDGNFSTAYTKSVIFSIATGSTGPYDYTSPTASSQCWVGKDFGAKYVITQISYAPATGAAANMELGVFEGANQPDFGDAIPLYMVNTASTPTGAFTTVSITCSRGFRYVRYLGPAYDDGTWRNAVCNIAELQFSGYQAPGDDTQLPQITNLPSVVVHTKNAEEINIKEQ